MRFVVVGPTYPYRGGIAHYTTLLVQELRKQHPVTFYSFKQQYPSFLFPGATDRDNSARPLQVNCEYPLDPLNPLTWPQTARKILAATPDILLMAWWHPYWAIVWLYLATRARKRGLKVLYIAHNVVSHEAPIWDKWLTRAVLSKSDGVIVHSEEELKRLKNLLPQTPAKIAPLPTFAPLNKESPSLSQDDARMQLGLTANKPVALFFGFVRPYKGLTILLEAIAQLKAKLDLHLLVVGEFWLPEQDIREIINRLKLSENVTIVNKYVPNEALGQYFAAAEVVVLPYLSATGSAVAQLAFGFNKPVIATTVGGLKEAIFDGETGLLIPPNDCAALAEALQRFFGELRHQNWTEAILARNQNFSWERMARQIIEMSSQSL